MEKILNLTSEQQEKLRDNRKKQEEQISRLSNQLKEKRQILQQELKKSSVTKESLAPVITELKSLQAQLIDIRIEGILAVKQLLTPEQFEQFQQIMDERLHKWSRYRNKQIRENQ